MALTQLSDVIKPDFYGRYDGIDSMTSSALFQSGVLVENPVLTAELGNGGNVVNFPAWTDLAAAPDPGGSEPNISSDDPAVLSTPKKLAAINQKSLKSYLNDSWSAADLAVQLAGSEPGDRVAEALNRYWQRQYEYRLIASLHGVYLENIANNGSDMTVDISSATDGAPVTVNGEDYTSPNIARNAVIDTATTMGDRVDDLRALAVHSAVYRDLAKADAIEFVRVSSQDFDIPTAFGLRLIKDDNLSLGSGKYLNVLFAAGSVEFGEAPGRVPWEVFRAPDKGNGGGVETLHSRRINVIHPKGFSYVGTPAATSPTAAELATSSSWSRVFPQRKQIPMAFLITKAGA